MQEARVYIVDDDEDVRESLLFLLESVGITATIFADADEFLDGMDPDLPACLILDVRMPRLSGLQLQERLNELDLPIPTIFCSGHGDIRMSVRALQHGAVDFLEKPYDAQHMIDVVQANLSRAVEQFAARDRRRQVAARLSALTPRERQILRLVIDGLPSQNIARQVGASVKTVDVHRARIKTKTDSDSLATLVRDILQTGVEV